jgi:LAS superfamily LD-carboxypeptidase LdcB
VNISGGGYRSTAEQTRLRIANCSGDTTNPNAVCKPLTALPGQSNHNNGKAFDLQCDGATILNVTNKCFVWLNTNARNYGLYNLPGEPWHWSVDGH